MRKYTHSLALLATIMSCSVAAAAVPQSCRSIHLANAGWTDNEVQNAVFTVLAKDLGYSIHTNLYSEEIMYAGMKNKKIDIFLDDWHPSMNNITNPYVKHHQIDMIGPALTGAKYTLGVPDYLYKRGLKNFSDIHKFGKQLDYKIYGIEPGADGNKFIQKMIGDKKYGLGNFHLVQSSEAGMLAEVKRRYDHKKDVVFLAWEPNSMNIEFDIHYLPGGSKYFGPNEGASKVYINTWKGYTTKCTNIGHVLNKFRLTVNDENAMMYAIQVKNEKAIDVAEDWLRNHKSWLMATLHDTKTISDKAGVGAIWQQLSSSQ